MWNKACWTNLNSPFPPSMFWPSIGKWWNHSWTQFLTLRIHYSPLESVGERNIGRLILQNFMRIVWLVIFCECHAFLYAPVVSSGDWETELKRHCSNVLVWAGFESFRELTVMSFGISGNRHLVCLTSSFGAIRTRLLYQRYNWDVAFSFDCFLLASRISSRRCPRFECMCFAFHALRLTVEIGAHARSKYYRFQRSLSIRQEIKTQKQENCGCEIWWIYSKAQWVGYALGPLLQHLRGICKYIKMSVICNSFEKSICISLL